jgi:hypothetical protein
MGQTTDLLQYDLTEHVPTTETVNQYEVKWGEWSHRELITKALIFKSQLREMIARASGFQTAAKKFETGMLELKLELDELKKAHRLELKVYRLKVARVGLGLFAAGGAAAIIVIILVRLAISGRFD